MPGSFLCSAHNHDTPISTRSQPNRLFIRSQHALLFHCGFFLASLLFFFRVSFTLFFTFSLLLIVCRLLVSASYTAQYTAHKETTSCLLLRIRGMLVGREREKLLQRRAPGRTTFPSFLKIAVVSAGAGERLSFHTWPRNAWAIIGRDDRRTPYSRPLRLPWIVVFRLYYLRCGVKAGI